MEMTDIAIDAYIAGLIDGEGSFGVWIYVSRQSKRPEGSHYLRRYVTVSNTHEPTIRWLHGECGGHVVRIKRHDPRHKPGWQLYVHDKQAVVLALRVLPYLRIKRRQAEIIVEISQLKRVFGGGGGSYIPEDVKAARAVLAAEMKALNHRGLDPDLAPVPL